MSYKYLFVRADLTVCFWRRVRVCQWKWPKMCERDLISLSFLIMFCSFTPLFSTKKKKKKCKKHLQILFILLCVQQIKIILCRVPETWSTFCHFGSFYSPFIALKIEKVNFFLKTKKKCLDISSVYTCAPQRIMIWWMVHKI